MKIISKYKDYYDYVAGIYGIDPKLILDRRDFTTTPQYGLHGVEKISLYICGNYLEGLRVGSNYYYGESLLQFGEVNKSPFRFYRHHSQGGRVVHIKTDQFIEEREYTYTNSYEVSIDTQSTNINRKQDCPILISHGYQTYLKFPILENLGVASVYSPEVMFQMLTDWLSNRLTERERVIDSRSDIQKLESKGFDKRGSFRPKMKT